ncbi:MULTISPECIES: hypothetical protein [Sphingomonas]|uniref:hypothetical protein n=1 Tax=Sphingomonas TaxID=13687 RepID=UPI000DEEE152|nr:MULTISPECIES: hypothetical protein [Sphingomonas]
MRKFIIAAAVATSALAAAAPAAAQYYQGQPYGYGQPGYGQQYGYNQGGQNYMVRIDRLTQRIDMLGQRGILSRGEYRGLRNEAQYLRERIARTGYNGLRGSDRRDVEWRLQNLERRIYAEARDGRGGWNNNQGQYGNGYNGDPRYDRDRDGRDDRYEDDHGRYPG